MVSRKKKKRKGKWHYVENKKDYNTKKIALDSITFMSTKFSLWFHSVMKITTGIIHQTHRTTALSHKRGWNPVILFLFFSKFVFDRFVLQKQVSLVFPCVVWYTRDELESIIGRTIVLRGLVKLNQWRVNKPDCYSRVCVSFIWDLGAEFEATKWGDLRLVLENGRGQVCRVGGVHAQRSQTFVVPFVFGAHACYIKKPYVNCAVDQILL